MAARGFSLFQKGLVLLAAPVCFQVLLVALIAQVRQSGIEDQTWSRHAMRVQRESQTLLQSLLDIFAYGRAHLLSDDPDFLRKARAIEATLPEQLTTLEQRVDDNPQQLERLAAIRPAIEQFLRAQHAQFAAAARGDEEAATRADSTRRLWEQADALRRSIGDVAAAEEALSVARWQASVESRRRISGILVGSVAASLLISLLEVAYFSRNISRRLAGLSQNAQRLARGTPLLPPLEGHDEIAELDQVFHAVAAELAASEQALRDRQQLLQLILESMGEGVVVADPRGQFLLFNRAATDMFGVGPLDVPLERWSETYGIYLPDRTTPFPTDDLPLARALRGEERDAVEMFIRDKHGRFRRWLNTTGRPLRDGHGELVGGVIVCRDVTQQKQSEQRFVKLLEAAPDAIVIVDEQGRIAHINCEAERLFGYSREMLQGQFIETLLPARLRARHVEHRRRFMAAPSSRAMGANLELFGLRRDGTEFPVDVSLSSVETDQGRLVMSAIRDATERKRQEEAIRSLNAELEQRVEQRTEQLAAVNRELLQRNAENETFVYSVSHDLRSPLVNLQGFSRELGDSCQILRSIVAESALPPEAKQQVMSLLDSDMSESIRFMQTAVMRLSRIIDALLRLSRAGRLEYQESRLDTNTLVGRIVDALGVTLAERSAEVVVDDLPPLWGDATAIEQVLANLIGNAVNYLDPQRPGRVEVGLHELDQLGQRATLFVRDNGLGIPAAYAGRVFQAFQRLHPNRAPGEGIGLAIVQRTVERHGGKIWFESTEGQGATFFVTLPSRPMSTRDSAWVDAPAEASLLGTV